MTIDRALLTTASHDPAARLVIGGCAAGNVVIVRDDVPEDIAAEIRTLADDEPPLGHPNADPVHRDAYVTLLSWESPVTKVGSGLRYVFPDALSVDRSIAVLRSGTPDGDRFFATLSGDRRDFDGWDHPVVGRIDGTWCMAMVDGRIASIAETVRIGPASAEVGITTAPAWRGRGYAAAATAGWATHDAVRDRLRFYSCDASNRSSRRVAERLGLRFVGASFSLS